MIWFEMFVMTKYYVHVYEFIHFCQDYCKFFLVNDNNLKTRETTNSDNIMKLCSGGYIRPKLYITLYTCTYTLGESL